MSNGTKEIVLSSGSSSETGTTTEVLNLDTMTWSFGPDFPTETGTWIGASLPFENSFLAIGGYNLGHRDEFWYFNPDIRNWEVIGRMHQGRELFAAIALPNNVCDRE